MADGHISKVKLQQSTGNEDIDKLLESTFLASGKLPQLPAADMPQPVVLRIKPLSED